MIFLKNMIVSLESVKTMPSVVTIETLAIIFSNKGTIRLIRCVFSLFCISFNQMLYRKCNLTFVIMSQR